MRSRAGRLGVVAEWELINGWGACRRDFTEATAIEDTKIAPDA